jgi:hypothetical protein
MECRLVQTRMTGCSDEAHETGRLEQAKKKKKKKNRKDVAMFLIK